MQINFRVLLPFFYPCFYGCFFVIISFTITYYPYIKFTNVSGYFVCVYIGLYCKKIKTKSMKSFKKLIVALVIVIGAAKVNAQCYLNMGPDQSICCPGGVLTIYPSFNNTVCACTNTSVVWTPTAGVNQPWSINSTLSPNVTTTYTVCVTSYSAAGCTTVCCVACDVIKVTVNNSCCRIGNFNSESPDKNYDGVSVYPNPAKTDFTIEFKNEIKNAEAALYDVSGRKVWSKSGVQGVGKLNVDIGMLPKGIYFIKVYSGDEEMYSKKMILE